MHKFVLFKEIYFESKKLFSVCKPKRNSNLMKYFLLDSARSSSSPSPGRKNCYA